MPGVRVDGRRRVYVVGQGCAGGLGRGQGVRLALPVRFIALGGEAVQFLAPYGVVDFSAKASAYVEVNGRLSLGRRQRRRLLGRRVALKAQAEDERHHEDRHEQDAHFRHEVRRQAAGGPGVHLFPPHQSTIEARGAT